MREMAGKSGMVIAIEGLDLAGKTTLARHVADALQGSGYQAVLVHKRREKYEKRYYEDVVQAIKRLHKVYVYENENVPYTITAACLCLQFLILYQERVIPAVREGNVVIVDSGWLKVVCRFAVEVERAPLHKHYLDSEFESWMLNLFPYYACFPYAQLVCLLDAEPAVCWKRLQDSQRARKGVIERMDRETFMRYQSSVREKLLRYASALDWAIIKCDDSRPLERFLEDASQRILESVRSHAATFER